ncbi:hypothetical protein LH53_05540 [Mesotoga sp. TolDC]|nr:hypothetical protein LH53_05540 [Mesotoga sp. TolDC]
MDARLAKIMPGRKARFAGKDPQSQSATQADLLYLSSHSKLYSSCRGERLFARRGGSPLTGARKKPKVVGLLTQSSHIRQGSPSKDPLVACQETLNAWKSKGIKNKVNRQRSTVRPIVIFTPQGYWR